MNALLNRTAKPKASTKERFIFDNYLFNNTLQELALGDDVVKLSFRESALLKMLMEHKNQVLDRRMALDSLWGAIVSLMPGAWMCSFPNSASI